MSGIGEVSPLAPYRLGVLVHLPSVRYLTLNTLGIRYDRVTANPTTSLRACFLAPCMYLYLKEREAKRELKHLSPGLKLRHEKGRKPSRPCSQTGRYLPVGERTRGRMRRKKRTGGGSGVPRTLARQSLISGEACWVVSFSNCLRAEATGLPATLSI